MNKKKDRVYGSKYFTASDEVVYQISIEDLQTVALELIDRELSKGEIEKVAEKVGDYIGWYDSIRYAMIEALGAEVISED